MAWAVRLSSVCLSSVTLLHPRNFNSSSFFALPNISGTRTVCIKILGKNLKGFYGIVQVKYNGGMKNWPYSTNISLYFENGKRYGHSYNGRRIETRMRSIKWCRFQLPSITPNLHFKVTIFWTSNNSIMVPDRAIVKTANQYKVVYDLSIDTIFNDLEKTCKVVWLPTFHCRPMWM